MIVFILLSSGCKNPFSPSFDDSTGNFVSTVSDQKTIEGVFQNFQYSYTFKDTTIYAGLITEDFIFTFRDYDQGFDVSWGRDDELKTTNGLFENTVRLDLIWNNIVLSSVDSLTANIVRGFNLTVTFTPTDIVRLDGRVNLALKKETVSGRWRITKWIDESNF